MWCPFHLFRQCVQETCRKVMEGQDYFCYNGFDPHMFMNPICVCLTALCIHTVRVNFYSFIYLNNYILPFVVVQVRDSGQWHSNHYTQFSVLNKSIILCELLAEENSRGEQPLRCSLAVLTW